MEQSTLGLLTDTEDRNDLTQSVPTTPARTTLEFSEDTLTVPDIINTYYWHKELLTRAQCSVILNSLHTHPSEF